ncbi:MAG TPA: EutN/CcmL family microcompartment protein [Anaerolineae bacterium]|nr:EutN/CcmL family microcompartment protein [Anaerolineae bacterium]
MQLARVTGTLVATRKDEKMEGMKFLIVRPINPDGQEIASAVVAVDAVGAGVGEVVMIATGSSARQTVLTDRRPCDAVIMAIVDTWEVGGEVKYRKE